MLSLLPHLLQKLLYLSLRLLQMSLFFSLFTLSNAVDFVELALSVIDLSLSFAAFSYQLLCFQPLILNWLQHLLLLAIREVFVANAEPDTANASDVNVKSDFKDFHKNSCFIINRFN